MDSFADRLAGFFRVARQHHRFFNPRFFQSRDRTLGILFDFVCDNNRADKRIAGGYINNSTDFAFLLILYAGFFISLAFPAKMTAPSTTALTPKPAVSL